MKLLTCLLDWLYPEKCVLCGRVLQRQELDLCHACRTEAPDCTRFRAKFPFISQWIALWRYEGNVRSSLHRYKFYGHRVYAKSYGRLLAMRLLTEEMTDFDILTYVPVSRKRLRRRGYDQVQLFAEAVAAELNVPCRPTLEKFRHNRQQSMIVGDAQRRANVLGVYRVLQEAELSGKRVLLLDDIVTTGATASECARVLLTAGAKEVHLAVLATADHQK